MRIVAGAFGGRRLVAPAGEATRPTTDRVREALFSILAGRGAIEGARVLDLYAGTGALGLEALSRGAVHATFVEAGRPALAALRDNVRALGVGGATTVVAARAEKWVKTAGEPSFDLVLADPPWADVARACEVIAALVERRLVAEDGLVVLEHAARDADVAIAGLEVVDERAWGDTAAWLGRPVARPA